MNYLSLTSDELWDELRKVDKEIANLDINAKDYNHHHESLMETRAEIIQTFIDGVGYNPDNLCRIKESDVIEKAQENPDIYPYSY